MTAFKPLECDADDNLHKLNNIKNSITITTLSTFVMTNQPISIDIAISIYHVGKKYEMMDDFVRLLWPFLDDGLHGKAMRRLLVEGCDDSALTELNRRKVRVLADGHRLTFEQSSLLLGSATRFVRSLGYPLEKNRAFLCAKYCLETFNSSYERSLKTLDDAQEWGHDQFNNYVRCIWCSRLDSEFLLVKRCRDCRKSQCFECGLKQLVKNDWECSCNRCMRRFAKSAYTMVVADRRGVIRSNIALQSENKRLKNEIGSLRIANEVNDWLTTEVQGLRDLIPYGGSSKKMRL